MKLKTSLAIAMTALVGSACMSCKKPASRDMTMKDNEARMEETRRAVAPVPLLTVKKLPPNQVIRIDGSGSDPAWATAASTGMFVDVRTGAANPNFPANGSAKLMWDENNMYVLIDVNDPNLQPGFTTAAAEPSSWTTKGQPMLWTRDTVEIMLDPDGDGDNIDYYELQINPQNKLFHSHFDSYNSPKTTPRGPFGHEDWDPKLKSAVTIRTEDAASGKRAGYTVEAAIPWSAFEKAEHHPPIAGDTWRMNFYVMKNNAGTAWSPILGQGNFHKASRFGKVTWAE